jgi:hypothetical protein
MNRKGILLVCVLALTLYGLPCQAQSAGSAALIKYGIVESSGTVQKDARHAGGAVAGGMAGLIFAGPRRRLLKVAATSAAGAAIQGAVTSGTLQQYTVKLLNGTEIKVSTEQTDIRVGDCVAVERGQHVNIRHVGMVHCEVDYKPKPPAHHKSVATDCQKAKDELTKAENDKDLDLAVKKVRVLCGL